MNKEWDEDDDCDDKPAPSNGHLCKRFLEKALLNLLQQQSVVECHHHGQIEFDYSKTSLMREERQAGEQEQQARVVTRLKALNGTTSRIVGLVFGKNQCHEVKDRWR